MIRLDMRPAENKPLAIAFVLSAALIFACSDAVSKVMVAQISPIEASWLRSVVVMVLTLPLAYRRAGAVIFRPHHPLRQVLRGAAVLASSLLFLTGLTYLPLADASAINFIWPVLITVFAVIFLGEKVGIRRVGATIVGFLGMLLIVRPGSGAFQTAAIYPLGGAAFWALANVMTRLMSATDPPETTIVWSSAVMLLGTTLALPFVWTTPDAMLLGLGLVVGIGSAVGHALIVFALERSNASTLAPFSYIQLVWATLIGYLAFGTIPDRWIFAGAALIVASGLYTAHRERVRGRTS
jgi:drug/metabolite transporter (DMT)-like permease